MTQKSLRLQSLKRTINYHSGVKTVTTEKRTKRNKNKTIINNKTKNFPPSFPPPLSINKILKNKSITISILKWLVFPKTNIDQESYNLLHLKTKWNHSKGGNGTVRLGNFRIQKLFHRSTFFFLH